MILDSGLLFWATLYIYVCVGLANTNVVNFVTNFQPRAVFCTDRLGLADNVVL